MKKLWLIQAFTVMLLAGSWIAPLNAHAEGNDDAMAAEESAPEASKDHPKMREALKTKFNVTDAQIQSMLDKGMKFHGVAMAAVMASKSGKSIDEVAKMRTEGKMGWPKIAKELGVTMKDVSQAVKEMKKEIREKRHAERDARHEKREEKREAKHQERAHKKSN